MEYYVYLHIKADTGEPFYIGKGKKYRAYTDSKRSQIWNNYKNKYGFDVILLEKNLTEEEAFKKEIYWINRIGRLKLNNGLLINLTDGGEGSSGRIPWNKGLKDIFSEQVRKKISETHKGNTYKRGKKSSKETIEKMINTKQELGQFKPFNTRSVINTKTREIFKTVEEAAKSIGIKRTTLNAKLTGQNKNNTNFLYYDYYNFPTK